MGIKTSKKTKIIRSRYIINQEVTNDVFYSIHEGVDTQLQQDVFILNIHSQLVSSSFVDFLVDRLTRYLYFSISGLFELSDYEFDGQSFYIIYRVPSDSLVTLDLHMEKIQNDDDYSEQIFHILHRVLEVLYELEKQQYVFGALSLNNIYISDHGDVFLGPAMVSLACLEFFMSNIDLYDESIYLAPEFIKSFEMTVKTDIYSFGMLAFYIYTRKWPYNHGLSIMNLKRQFQSGPLEPKAIFSSISEQLNYFILKSIQLNPDERWGTFRTLIQVLEGREDHFERLSNQFVDQTMFESDIVQEKRRIFTRIVNFGLGILTCIGVVFLGIFIYSSYF